MLALSYMGSDLFNSGEIIACGKCIVQFRVAS